MPYLEDIPARDLFGEIRRREIHPNVLFHSLGLQNLRHVDPAAQLRKGAFIALATVTMLLISVISYLAIEGKEIPDLLSGLAGSGIGAIAAGY